MQIFSLTVTPPPHHEGSGTPPGSPAAVFDGSLSSPPPRAFALCLSQHIGIVNWKLFIFRVVCTRVRCKSPGKGEDLG